VSLEFIDMDNSFFSEFSSVSADEWRERIIKDLKGKPYEGLLKETKEGITVRPDYSTTNESVDGIPGEPPYLRGLHRTPEPWSIVENIRETRSNASVLAALNNGATALQFSPASVANGQLENVLFNYISFFLTSGYNLEGASEFIGFLNQKGFKASELQGSLGLTPLSSGLKDGTFTTDLEYLMRNAFALAKANPGLSKVRFFNVEGVNLSNAGASAATEIGSSLAEAHAYLVAGLENGLSTDDVSATIQFNLGIGTDFFLELTKFRVIRKLWSRIVEQYQPEHSCSMATYLYGETSKRYFSIADMHTNMIRTTTMVASAALGEADAIHALPFDVHRVKNPEFGQRIARNVSLILQEESYLQRVLDPAGGSYFMDELSEELSNNAWKFFQEIESHGGFVKAAASNFIQNRIEEEASEELEALKNESRIMVGVNKFPNANDDLSGLTPSVPPRVKDFKPLFLQRISEPFELTDK
jgi:methylmalonyl-CoA mutase